MIFEAEAKWIILWFGESVFDKMYMSIMYMKYAKGILCKLMLCYVIDIKDKISSNSTIKH